MSDPEPSYAEAVERRRLVRAITIILVRANDSATLREELHRDLYDRGIGEQWSPEESAEHIVDRVMGAGS